MGHNQRRIVGPAAEDGGLAGRKGHLTRDVHIRHARTGRDGALDAELNNPSELSRNGWLNLAPHDIPLIVHG